VKNKTELDLRSEPPSDIVIEIDITSPSLDKFAMFAHIGVPEVWRYADQQLRIFRLIEQEYVEQAESDALPRVTSIDVSRFLDDSRTLERLAWLRQVREWTRSLR